MDSNSVQGFGEAMMASFTTAMAIFMSAIPKIIGFLVILVVGWFIASLIAKGVAMLLRSVRFNELSQRAGISDFVQSAGVKTDSSGFLANIVKWFVRLLALVVAFDALGLPAVSQVLRDFLLWLPNLVVALVVVVIGGLAARALANVVRGATAKAQLGNPDLLARIAGIAVWGFTAVVAVNQLGIAESLVNTLFMALVGAVALAVGLAFGLGGRDEAAQLLRQWRARGELNAERLREAASTAGQMTQDRASQVMDTTTTRRGETVTPRGPRGDIGPRHR
jgi:hypothetical protein